MSDKKQVPLRIGKELFEKLNAIAEADFRSLNGEIEYILHDYVVRRCKTAPSASKKQGDD